MGRDERREALWWAASLLLGVFLLGAVVVAVVTFGGRLDRKPPAGVDSRLGL